MRRRMIIFSIMIALSMSFGACGVEKEDLKAIYDEANNQQEKVKEETQSAAETRADENVDSEVSQDSQDEQRLQNNDTEVSGLDELEESQLSDSDDNMKSSYDVEEEVNKIRDIYYRVQGDSSNLTKQDGGSVTRWIDSNGKIRKIVAPAGTYDDTNGADAAKYNAEFYYNENEELVFVFLYSGKEEHRLYVVQGECVRYIGQDGSVNDYPELKEAESVCDLGYFIGLGMMEIHYAYV